jgi:hypothetical protein
MRILISGASRGLGKSIAYRLAAEKHNLILIARSESLLNELKVELEGRYAVDVLPIAADLSKKEAFHFISSIIGTNVPDIIINNLGVYKEGGASTLKKAFLNQQLDLNLMAAIELNQLFIEELKRRRNGLIVHINSIMGVEAKSLATAYSISKHALKAYSDALREELRADGIKVSTIYPAAINTSSWDGIEANKEQMIQTDDVAELIACRLKRGGKSIVEEIHLSSLNFST